MSIFIKRGKTLIEKIKNLIYFGLDIQLKDILLDFYTELSTYIKDAPKTGLIYGRQNGEWSVINGGGAHLLILL